MAPLVSITDTLALSRTSSPSVDGIEEFTSARLWTPCGARGVFGGQVVGQALVAASQTVEGLDLHSQHCYFLLPASSAVPITYTVERLRNGKSYAARLVKAIQSSRPVFILIASFTAPPHSIPILPDPLTPLIDKNPPKTDSNDELESESTPSSGGDTTISHSLAFRIPLGGKAKDARGAAGPFVSHFQTPFPTDVMPWDKCIEEEVWWTRLLRKLDARGSAPLGRRRLAVEEYIKERTESPVSIAVARQQGQGKTRTTRCIWLKPRLGEGETLDDRTVRALFGLITDFQFIGTASRTVGLTGTSTPRLGMMASLDHTTHYYPLPDGFDPRAPLLHVMEAVIVNVASGRGVVRGLLFTEGGVLVATTSQEGVIRADFGLAKL